jgi:sugar phosphate isomerase/epimerase
MHHDFDRVLPGKGVLDLPKIVPELERHSYEEYFSVELLNSDLWQLPLKERALRCYESLQPLYKD